MTVPTESPKKKRSDCASLSIFFLAALLCSLFLVGLIQFINSKDWTASARPAANAEIKKPRFGFMVDTDSSHGDAVFKIFDSMGTLIKTSKGEPGIFNDLPSGSYTLVVIARGYKDFKKSLSLPISGNPAEPTLNKHNFWHTDTVAIKLEPIRGYAARGKREEQPVPEPKANVVRGETAAPTMSEIENWADKLKTIHTAAGGDFTADLQERLEKALQYLCQAWSLTPNRVSDIIVATQDNINSYRPGEISILQIAEDLCDYSKTTQGSVKLEELAAVYATSLTSDSR